MGRQAAGGEHERSFAMFKSQFITVRTMLQRPGYLYVHLRSDEGSCSKLTQLLQCNTIKRCVERLCCGGVGGLEDDNINNCDDVEGAAACAGVAVLVVARLIICMSVRNLFAARERNQCKNVIICSGYFFGQHNAPIVVFHSSLASKCLGMDRALSALMSAFVIINILRLIETFRIENVRSFIRLFTQHRSPSTHTHTPPAPERSICA